VVRQRTVEPAAGVPGNEERERFESEEAEHPVGLLGAAGSQRRSDSDSRQRDKKQQTHWTDHHRVRPMLKERLADRLVEEVAVLSRTN